MTRRIPYRLHLRSADDLLTPYEAVRAGFVELALEKNRRATPFVEQARALKIAASQAANPRALLVIPEIKVALLTAAGISDKAANHLQAQDQTNAVMNLIEKFLEPAGAAFVEELVFRFLLTRGDTLGGSMRNVGGVLAQRKLTRALVSTLSLRGIAYWWMHASNDQWLASQNDDVDIENLARGLSWRYRNTGRTIRFNLTVPPVKNNVDVSLFDRFHESLSPAVLGLPSAYIALGELKGGIDPAGADEHWKTAQSALTRIRKAFARRKAAPHLFYVGAAIEKKMAAEIWQQLQAGTLANAANLTSADQIASLARWLCDL